MVYAATGRPGHAQPFALHRRLPGGGGAQGVQQYVILGAGLETFAFRQPELMKQLHVFEVDHPATQAFKQNRLAELGWNVPPNLYFVPVDFSSESLTAALHRSAYDPAKRLSSAGWALHII